jgi:trimeric autotransporter adhesin
MDYDVKVVSISFQQIATENGYDYIRVYDGDNSSSNLIVELSGDNPSRRTKYYSSQSNMFVKFTSDSSVFASGFSASYISKTPGT